MKMFKKKPIKEGFHKVLDYKMFSLGFEEGDYTVNWQDGEFVLRVTGLDKMGYEKLASKLKPVFSPHYSSEKAGLLFAPVGVSTGSDNEAKGLSAKDKKYIIDDFKKWTGGSGPDEVDAQEIENYVRTSLETKFDSKVVKKWLMSLCLGESEEDGGGDVSSLGQIPTGRLVKRESKAQELLSLVGEKSEWLRVRHEKTVTGHRFTAKQEEGGKSFLTWGLFTHGINRLADLSSNWISGEYFDFDSNKWVSADVKRSGGKIFVKFGDTTYSHDYKSTKGAEFITNLPSDSPDRDLD